MSGFNLTRRVQQPRSLRRIAGEFRLERARATSFSATDAFASEDFEDALPGAPRSISRLNATCRAGDKNCNSYGNAQRVTHHHRSSCSKEVPVTASAKGRTSSRSRYLSRLVARSQQKCKPLDRIHKPHVPREPGKKTGRPDRGDPDGLIGFKG